MRIAVLSGKGGTGKTFVSVNLSAAIKNSVYIDCDAEEPNGRLFFEPDDVIEKVIYTELPEFDLEKCDGCKKCVEFCKFNALAYIKGKMMIFPEVCHSCGGCQMVCPNNAVRYKKKRVGIVERGKHGTIDVTTGVLDMGEASSIPVIKDALNDSHRSDIDVIIDCPPGSACSVMESIEDVDYCILVTEPNAFGFHNFKMVYELVSLLGKPLGVIVNKDDSKFCELDEFCDKNNLEILARIPYNSEFARLISDGKIVYENNDIAKLLFEDIVLKIKDSIQGED